MPVGNDKYLKCRHLDKVFLYQRPPDLNICVFAFTNECRQALGLWGLGVLGSFGPQDSGTVGSLNVARLTAEFKRKIM